MRTDRPTDWHKNMTKLIVAFRNFANGPKNAICGQSTEFLLKQFKQPARVFSSALYRLNKWGVLQGRVKASQNKSETLFTVHRARAHTHTHTVTQLRAVTWRRHMGRDSFPVLSPSVQTVERINMQIYRNVV